MSFPSYFGSLLKNGVFPTKIYCEDAGKEEGVTCWIQTTHPWSGKIWEVETKHWGFEGCMQSILVYLS